MKLFKLVWSCSLVVAGAVIAFSQQRPAQRQHSNVHISKDHPTVYLSFVKVGQAKPLNNGESNERLWLKFHNNTKWNLRLHLAGDPPKEYGIGITYAVKTIPKHGQIITSPKAVPLFTPPGVDIPKRDNIVTPAVPKDDDCEELDFFSGGHVFVITELKPGKSFVFSVPREYLCKRNKVCVSYEYEWEHHSDEPEHIVCFSGGQIPTDSKPFPK